uniref:Epithelial membrane protein 1 n=1 Tax=Anabas testudineus TaxID=64144 RepID=A0A3Q1JGV3_ANATE
MFEHNIPTTPHHNCLTEFFYTVSPLRVCHFDMQHVFRILPHHTHTHTHTHTQPVSLSSSLSLAPPADYLQAVQATSILACIFSILGIFVFVAQLFTLEKGKRFTISGIFQFVACLCIMIAASIYTDRFHLQENGWYGHCFILAWISFALTFISSIIYFVLRKKTA